MPVDLIQLGTKVKRYREQRLLSPEELSSLTGIAPELLIQIESGQRAPTGDQILIFADVFQCDYRFFISNEQLAPFEQTETLYRRYGSRFTKEDRLKVQEFLFLCESEETLYLILEMPRSQPPEIRLTGSSYKFHGKQAAEQLRTFLKYAWNVIPLDIYRDFRSLGWHVFRRELSDSNISGLCIRHPKAGNCILINYSEDVYRQRFSVAHEAAHALIDREEDVVVSFWRDRDLREIRTNSFASHFLVPPRFLKSIPEPTRWSKPKTIEWANKFKVSSEVLSIALKEAGLISPTQQSEMKRIRVPREMKTDPELPAGLAPRSRERKEAMLKRGLSSSYVNLCFEAFHRDCLTAARTSEMLLTTEDEMRSIAEMYGVALTHVS